MTAQEQCFDSQGRRAVLAEQFHSESEIGLVVSLRSSFVENLQTNKQTARL